MEATVRVRRVVEIPLTQERLEADALVAGVNDYDYVASLLVSGVLKPGDLSGMKYRSRVWRSLLRRSLDRWTIAFKLWPRVFKEVVDVFQQDDCTADDYFFLLSHRAALNASQEEYTWRLVRSRVEKEPLVTDVIRLYLFAPDEETVALAAKKMCSQEVRQWLHDGDVETALLYRDLGVELHSDGVYDPERRRMAQGRFDRTLAEGRSLYVGYCEELPK